MKEKQLLKIEEQIIRKLSAIKKNVYEIGRLLYTAKKLDLVHGKFMSWVEETFGDQLSYQTANIYMNVYIRFQGRPDLVEMLPVTYLLDISRMALPDSIIEGIDKAIEDGTPKDEIKKKIRKYRDEWRFKDFSRFQRKIIYDFNVVKQISHFDSLSERIDSLRFNKDNSKIVICRFLDALAQQHMIQHIDKAIEVLNDAKYSFESALTDFRQALDDERIAEKEKAA
jgi:hypothetical protein